MPDSLPTQIKTELKVEKVAADLEAHLTRYRLHREEYLERQAHQDEMQEANLKAIETLAKATSGLVEVWTVANGLQRFIVWASKFAALGTVVYWVAKKLVLKH